MNAGNNNRITNPRLARAARYLFAHPNEELEGTRIMREANVNAVGVVIANLRYCGMDIRNRMEGRRARAGEYVRSTYTYIPKPEDAALRKEVGLE